MDGLMRRCKTSAPFLKNERFSIHMEHQTSKGISALIVYKLFYFEDKTLLTSLVKAYH